METLGGSWLVDTGSGGEDRNGVGETCTDAVCLGATLAREDEEEREEKGTSIATSELV